MVNPFKKKIAEEVFAGGRIIVTDFSKLKKEDFPLFEKGDMILFRHDGRIYIDSQDEASEAIVRVFKLLAQYPKAELRRWEKEQKRRYPDIKTPEDLKKLKGKYEDLMKALSMLLVPIELKSRETLCAYYGIL